MIVWNPWHGCTKVSAGCANCYMFRRDAKYGIDSTVVRKTKDFNQPLQRDRHKNYKIPSGETVFTCFTSDFFHPDADEWRPQAWAMMKERFDLNFYFITKRPERFYIGLPADWNNGYDNVTMVSRPGNYDVFSNKLNSNGQVDIWTPFFVACFQGYKYDKG